MSNNKFIEGLTNNISELSEANKFPVDVFPMKIQNIITETNRTLNYPIDFISASMLYTISVAIGNTYNVKLKNKFIHGGVLYIAIVGPPGSNKSHPLKFAATPITKKDSENFKKYETELKEYEAIKELSIEDKREYDIGETTSPTRNQMFVSDFTIEALIDVHKNNARGIGVKVDELGTWFNNFNRYNKGSDEEFWLSCWNGYEWTLNRKSGDVHIPKLSIPVIGTIQPGVLLKFAENREQNGFLDRILFVIPDFLKKDYWNEAELEPFYFNNWNDIINRLLDLPLELNDTGEPEPKLILFSDEAKKHLYKWQKENTNKHNDSNTDTEKGIYSKIETYIVRFALILEMMKFACMDSDKSVISLESVKGSIKLATYFINTAFKMHDILSNFNPIGELAKDKQLLYEELPETFLTKTGVSIANKFEIKERSFKEFIKVKNLFEKVGYGKYKKKF